MRLVLIELITAGGIELEASPLRATVDYFRAQITAPT